MRHLVNTSGMYLFAAIACIFFMYGYFFANIESHVSDVGKRLVSHNIFLVSSLIASLHWLYGIYVSSWLYKIAGDAFSWVFSFFIAFMTVWIGFISTVWFEIRWGEVSFTTAQYVSLIIWVVILMDPFGFVRTKLISSRAISLLEDGWVKRKTINQVFLRYPPTSVRHLLPVIGYLAIIDLILMALHFSTM